MHCLMLEQLLQSLPEVTTVWVWRHQAVMLEAAKCVPGTPPADPREPKEAAGDTVISAGATVKAGRVAAIYLLGILQKEIIRGHRTG